MNTGDIIRQELKQAAEVLDKFLQDEDTLSKIEEAASIISNSIQNGGKVISCGNGGSHCDAMHFAEEMTGKFRDDRAPLPAVAISDPGHITCVGNDYGFDQIFSRYIQALGKDGDVLLAITTSGNSQNIIEAVNEARNKGLKIITLTGNDGGKLAGLADAEIRVPHQGYADRIQEVHIKIIHILILLTESMVNGSKDLR